jgi:hypothetical protein
LRSLTQVYGEYEDRIHFIGIDVDGGESEGQIRSWNSSNGFTWPMIPADGQVLKDYRITVQASAVVLDANGIIVSRSSYSGSDKWQELFDSLLDG